MIRYRIGIGTVERAQLDVSRVPDRGLPFEGSDASGDRRLHAPLGPAAVGAGHRDLRARLDERPTPDPRNPPESPTNPDGDCAPRVVVATLAHRAFTRAIMPPLEAIGAAVVLPAPPDGPFPGPRPGRCTSNGSETIQ